MLLQGFKIRLSSHFFFSFFIPLAVFYGITRLPTHHHDKQETSTTAFNGVCGNAWEWGQISVNGQTNFNWYEG